MEALKIVVRYRDGRITKGYTYHFDPERPFLNIYEDPRGDSPVTMEIDQLKAVFLVKSFEGNREYNERKTFLESDRAIGRKVHIRFADGEELQGTIIGYDPQRSGFFLIPSDPESNNISLFAVSNAVVELQEI